MQNTDNNIEKLFKDTFQNFEADVNPNIWTNVQNRISSGAGSAGAAAKFTLGKIIAGIATIGVIGSGIWYASTNKNEKKNDLTSVSQNKTEIVSKPIEEKSIIHSENKSFNAPQPIEKKNSSIASIAVSEKNVSNDAAKSGSSVNNN